MFTTHYTTLFSINILHGYHLNNGEENYLDLNVDQQEKMMAGYDWSQYLQIRPTEATQKQFRRFQLLNKNTSKSLRMMVRSMQPGSQDSFIPLDQDLTLAFLISYRDPYFENYTDMNFLSGEKMFFSNFHPEVLGEEPFHPISLETTEEYFSDSFLLSAENFDLLLDAYRIKEAGKDTSGLLLIRMQGETGNLNVINVNNTLKINPTVFKVHFANRSTYWRYYQASSDTGAETNQPKPLTKNGFVQLSTETDFDTDPAAISHLRFPNPGVKHIQSDGINYYSEINI
ncbi:hypothetical protein SAMN04488057_10361 [Cyclobacterium lianum]|uniref:Uncharacterized protein n=1 Tax=Cyclobacterium lianum TaxID=388280 RepID=A0A1M7L169_9BACT|nr:hypothetical protein [Cyclobacterium lianum]SHM71601.1 hypothetical protein SAMN04488057_10361 [Cyclobacterium lianum]